MAEFIHYMLSLQGSVLLKVLPHSSIYIDKPKLGAIRSQSP